MLNYKKKLNLHIFVTFVIELLFQTNFSLFFVLLVGWLVHLRKSSVWLTICQCRMNERCWLLVFCVCVCVCVMEKAFLLVSHVAGSIKRDMLCVCYQFYFVLCLLGIARFINVDRRFTVTDYMFYICFFFSYINCKVYDTCCFLFLMRFFWLQLNDVKKTPKCDNWLWQLIILHLT